MMALRKSMDDLKDQLPEIHAAVSKPRMCL